MKKITYTINEKGCWIVTSHAAGKTYPVAAINGKRVRLNRWSLERKLRRPLLAGMQALHSCDEPKCINPDHLREGTALQNTHDTCARGRQIKGTRHHSAVLNEVLVIEARIAYARGECLRSLAVLRGVSFQALYTAALGRSWKHVPLVTSDGNLIPPKPFIHVDELPPISIQTGASK